MDDTWTTRELPVLDALAQALDNPRAGFVPDDLWFRLGMSEDDYQTALYWLLDGDYIKAARASGGVVVRVFSVTEKGRRAAGAWPTADGLADRLEVAFRAAAAAEPDPERKRWYQTAVGAFTGIGRAVTTDVLTQVVERQMGLG